MPDIANADAAAPLSPPFAALREHMGFIPGVFRAQSLSPGIADATAALTAAILFRKGVLSRIQKEHVLFQCAATAGDAYGMALHAQMLRLHGTSDAGLSQLLSSDRPDVVWGSEAALETALTVGLSRMLRALSTGLFAAPDFAVPSFAATTIDVAAPDMESHKRKPVELADAESSGFAPFREVFGFVPAVFRAQSARPDVLEAEARLARLAWFDEDRSARAGKHRALAAIAEAGRNSYFLALHEEAARLPGDHATADPRASALAEFVVRLANPTGGFSSLDVERLRRQGFREEAALEAVALVAFAAFLAPIQSAAGIEPDFPPRLDFPAVAENKVNLLTPESRPTDAAVPVLDPDADAVSRVQAGDINAFEELMTRHSQRVFRTLVGVLGEPEEARDALQDTFLKAFQHLKHFEGRSKFSTWLVSIANNAAIQRLRERRPHESLDEREEDGFRPRQIRAWTDNPEQTYSKAETRAMIEENIGKLPSRYRIVLVLRDVQQLSNEEAATALGLGVPALKTRLIRARLMLREALEPHFAAAGVKS